MGTTANEPEPGKTSAPGPSSLLADARPKVQLPGEGRLLSECASELGKCLSQHNLFQRGGQVFVVNEKKDGLRLMDDNKFRTWVENHVVFYRLCKAGRGQTIEFKQTVSKADAAGILASPQFLSELREVELINPIRMPALRANGQIELLPEGYDVESRTLTCGAVDMNHGMSLSEANSVLDELLKEFVFADSRRSKAVAIAAMLTVFAPNLLPAGSVRPCFIVLANAEGAGKTLLAKCAIVPVLGYAPVGTAPKDENEMRKLLLAVTLESRSVVFLDNVKGHLASESLEGFLTSVDYQGRVLGESKMFRGQNNAVVFITGNGCTVSPDLRRRSLFCEVFLEEERAEDRVFKNRLETANLIELRARILCALWALVQAWDAAGRPGPSRGNSSFPDWSDVFGGIVEFAGYGCALETPQIDQAADAEGTDMRALVVAAAAGATQKTLRFEDLVQIARSRGLFENMTPAEDQVDARANSSLGLLLRRYNRRIIAEYRFTIQGKGHRKTFTLEKLSRAPSTHGQHGLPFSLKKPASS